MAANASIPEDSLAVVRSRPYLRLLVFAAILGVPISAAAFWFLWAVHHAQHWIFATLPTWLGFETAPAWWPVPLLALGGLLVAAAIAYLPGKGGHSPAEGFTAGAPPKPAELPGVLLAALASLCFGAVVGPEGPLIALGSGLAALLLWSRKTSDQVIAVVGAAGAFAAVAFLLGSPIVGAFLMLEATGLTKPKAKVVLLPGLLCAGLGFLVALGLHSWTGVGKVSLAITDVPALPPLIGVEFLWAIGFGIGAAVVGSAIRQLALLLRPHVEKRLLIMTPLAGLGIGALALVYALLTGYGTSDVLFSGEESLPRLVHSAGTYPVATLVLLIALKSLAYALALSSFRGGPVFPAIFVGGTAGILLARLLGLPVTAGLAMGMGGMASVMLRMPMTAVLLATLLLGAEGINAMPLIIVAVVVAFVAAEWLAPSELAEQNEH